MGIHGSNDAEYIGVYTALKKFCPQAVAVDKGIFDENKRFTALTHNLNWPGREPYPVEGVEWGIVPENYNFRDAVLKLRFMGRQLNEDEKIAGVRSFVARFREFNGKVRDQFIVSVSDVGPLARNAAVDAVDFFWRLSHWLNRTGHRSRVRGDTALYELLNRMEADGKGTARRSRPGGLYFESHRVERVLKSWAPDKEVRLVCKGFDEMRDLIFMVMAGQYKTKLVRARDIEADKKNIVVIVRYQPLYYSGGDGAETWTADHKDAVVFDYDTQVDAAHQIASNIEGEVVDY